MANISFHITSKESRIPIGIDSMHEVNANHAQGHISSKKLIDIYAEIRRGINANLE